MASILEEFAYGNLSPEAHFLKGDPEYVQAMDCISGSEQKLLDRLSGTDRELFCSYADMQGEVHEIIAVKNLIYGFKLGLLMTAESFLDMDDLYVNGNSHS